MQIIETFLAFLVLSSKVQSVTPASCDHRCEWVSWNGWSDCSRECAGGIRRRDRPFCCKSSLAGDIVACMNDCGMNYEEQRSGFYDSEDCNTFCYNGGTFVSSGYCRCPDRYRGTCCQDVVTCGQPSSISHGSFTGSDFTYAGQVHYTCDENYNMTNPSQAIRTCTKNGYWSGSSPTCLYATSCNSNPCKNSAKCVNLLGDYRCDCTTGWDGKNCEIDIQPPIISGCPADIYVNVFEMTSKQSWTEPNITDPHGTEILTTQNYEISSYDFPWGVHTIQYTAVKLSNGLSAECNFKISVKPFPCRELDPPENGIVLCNGWKTEYSNICIFICKQNYTLQPGFKIDDIYVCGATGHWLPPNHVERCVAKELFPDNVVTQVPTCTSADEAESLADIYIDVLKRSPFNALCGPQVTGCTPENVVLKC